MNRRKLLSGIVAGAGTTWLARATPLCQEPQRDEASLSGVWGGILDLGSRSLRLEFRIVRSEDAWQATLVSLDQQNFTLAADEVRVEVGEPAGDPARDARLYARFTQISGELDVLQLGADLLAGTWKQGVEFALELHRDPDWAALAPKIEALDEDVLARLLDASQAPAIAAAVKKQGDPRLWACGLRAADAQEPVGLDDRWHLGSITKSMTATLVARLVDAGHLKWDMTVGDVLGERVPDMQTSYREANFLHLLSHRAGLQPNIPMPMLLALPRELAAGEDARVTRSAYVTQALAQEPAGPKEETFLYSNSGYVIAGAMIEAALGVSWEAAISEHVFVPLGLASAGFGPPRTPPSPSPPQASKPVLDEPVGHTPNPLSGFGFDRPLPVRPESSRADNPVALGPAGRVHMRLADLTEYLAAHRDRTDLLAPESWQRLHTPPFGGDYALGWIVRGDGVLWHNGSNTIWYAEVLVDRPRGLVAAAAANAAAPQTGPAVGRLLSAAAAAI